MELRHLRFFLMLADELHFTRAAARLHVAQPHLSQEIQRMERELGVSLFRRTRRRVELTPAGDAYREGAARVLAALAHAADSAGRAARGESGRLVVGFVGSVAWDPLPEAIRRFREERPTVRLVLKEQTTVKQLEALRRNAIDVGVMRPSLLDELDLMLEEIRVEEFVVAVPRLHPSARRRRVPLAALSSEPWIAFEYTAGPGLHAQFLEACGNAGFEPRIAQTAGHIPTMLSLVAGGLGVALIPAQVLTLRPQGVRLLRLAEPAPVTAVVAGWRREDDSPAVARFVELLREGVRAEHAAGADRTALADQSPMAGAVPRRAKVGARPNSRRNASLK
jgi:DNA-binding transcriptional LysR family regulator